ncbi:MAG: 2TM domain-containing protein [Bacteroidota bacterium]|nr:2TM domain-containing protein [Bacteroidota bacterium]
MENIQTDKERMLWKQAKKRVGFRNHLLSYLLVNTMLWVMWFVNGREMEEGLPWPIFCTLGWGFGLLWHFMGAFVFNNKLSQVEKEFEKLKAKNN